MAVGIKNTIPDAGDVLALRPHELAEVILPILKTEDRPLIMYNFAAPQGQSYGLHIKDDVIDAIAEAWAWLVSQGLLADDWKSIGAPCYFLTRQAHKIIDENSFESFRKASLLPKELLHPKILLRSWPNFFRGIYDTAVFEAFKEVEIAVRDASAQPPHIIGVDLMRKAFDPENGRLADKNLPKAERESLSHLFAGAIGSYKNPTSHRTVVINEANEAGEMLFLASHLLRIVDDRADKVDKN